MDINCKLKLINLYQCDAGFCTTKRIFDFYYILYVHSGQGVYKINNISYKANSGDNFYCLPFVENTIIAHNNNPFVLLEIEFMLHKNSEIILDLKRQYNISTNNFLIQSIKGMVNECTKNSINRILINATGLTLKNYQIDLKIKKASEFLAYSNKPLREISELVKW